MPVLISHQLSKILKNKMRHPVLYNNFENHQSKQAFTFFFVFFKVRDCSGIELLLDCSPPDAKNPMITQWVILAIQNLCQNNLENQKVVAKIDKKGQLDKKKLSELGIDIFDNEQK